MDRPTSPRTVAPVSTDRVSADGASSEGVSADGVGSGEEIEEAGDGAAENRRTVVVALVSNLGVALAKFVGFVVTGSVALLAEALHSLADTGNQALLLVGAKRASREPSARHPFGHGREHYFWAFIVGLVLFGLGGVVSIIEGTRKLVGGEHGIERPAVALVLIGVGAVFEGISLRTGLRAARTQFGREVGLWSGLRRSRDADVTVVVFEDTGALLGLALAAGGIVLSVVTGNAVFDAIATISIGLLLCVIAMILTIEMHSLLVGEPATRIDTQTLRDVMEGVDGVERIVELRTEHIGPRDLLVCAKLELDHALAFEQVVDLLDEVERRIVVALPVTFACFLEPDTAST